MPMPCRKRQPDLPRKPAPRQLSPYEAEQKARLIDRALHILRSDFPPAINRARSLESQGWNAFAYRNQSAYVDDLKECRDSLASCTGAMAELRRGTPEYGDIAAALQPTDIAILDSAMGNFLVTNQYLSVYPKEDAPGDAFENLIGPKRLALRSANR